MIQTKNIAVLGKHNKPILTDVFCNMNAQPKPIVVFCHGYKGFKDWGAWDVMAKTFVDAGFFFIKFNFSHNGGTVEQPIDFPDLEAFGANNYTKELDDLECIIDWICTHDTFKTEVDLQKLNLIGHSRGGGIALIKAAEDQRIAKLVTYAGVSDYAKRNPTGVALEQWQKQGVRYVKNGRTQQEMPHYYQFYEDFITNETRLSIKRAAASLTVPYLIVHGDADTSVLLEEGQDLYWWYPKSTLEVIAGADHVFNTKHPWEKETLSEALALVVAKTVEFLKA
jgi:pimeloyl-ACP methyl ester carboxylesterase